MMKNYELYKHTPVYTIKELLEFCAKTYDRKEAFTYDENGQPVPVSFKEFRDDVYALGSSLIGDGFAAAISQYWEKIVMSGY